MTRHGLGVAGLALVLLLGTVLASTTRAATWYVDDDAPAGGNGQSWPTAFRYLQDALHACTTGDEIRVAAGRYTPDRDEAGLVTPLDRYASFILVDGVALRGGYAGIGSANPDSQDVARYVTVLSGDLLDDDIWPALGTDNSRHVVTAEAVGPSTILEGLVIEAGYGHGSYTDVLSRSGGGVFSHGSSLQIRRCTFRHCYASRYGAALYHGGGGVVSLVNCFIERCQAESGAGVFVDGPSELVMDHCTIVDNLAETAGGGLFLRAATAAVTNCIFWDNRTEDEHLLPTEPGQVFADEASTLTVNHSCVQGWTGALAGVGNFDANPLLVRRGFRLQAGSPCIDAGSGDAGWTDIDSEAPGSGGVPDVGADEFVDSDMNGLPDRWEEIHFGTLTGADPDSDTDADGLTALEEYALNTSPVVARGVYYVDPAGDDTWDGLSPVADGTHGPKRTIQAAIDATRPGEIDVVVVRDGIFTGAGNRGLSLPAHDMVLRSENGPANCIIDCEKAERGIRVDRRQTSATAIRGLTIRRGKVLLSSSTTAYGGGIYCDHADATIRDCIIYECEAVGSGGYGGAVCLYGSRGRICDTFVAGNLAEGSRAAGGGIVLRRGSPQVERCVVLDNQARMTTPVAPGNSSGGGGIASDSSQSSIRDCLVAGNSAYCGGGICDVFCCGPSLDGTLGSCIERCEIRQNAATFGGGFYCEGAASDLVTCVIVRNLSTLTAAVHSWDYAYQWPFVTHCLIAENSNVRNWPSQSPLLAGISGVYFVSNSIVWGNDPLQAGEYVEMDYSSVQGGYPGIANIDEMPAFPVGQDWHLLPGSPGVDSGTNTPAKPLPLHDFDGAPRSVDGNGNGDARPDVGPYEYVPGVPRLAVSPSWIDVDVPRGGPEAEPVQLSIRNCGDGVLHWQASEDAPWLSLSTVEGESAGQTQTVEITFDTTGLTWGRYIAFVTFTSDGAATTQRRIPVTLHVRRVQRVPAQHATIQAAITAAQQDDVVMIADGIYNEYIYLQEKSITVRSENGPANCIIDRQYLGPGIGVHRCGPIPATIEGLTIRHAIDSGVNISYSDGVVLRNCRLLHNEGYRGGGLNVVRSRVSVVDCLFQGNVVPGEGGGVLAQEAVLTMRGCQVCENRSEITSSAVGGGGMSLSLVRGEIHGCRILGNSANGVGGGLDLRITAVRVSNSLIAGNLARNAGGVSVSGTFGNEQLLVQNAVIASNTATNGDGGGVGVGSGALRLQNSTVVGNTATWRGGGVYAGGDELDIRNSIVTDNTAPQGPQIAVSFGSLKARRSAVRGGEADIWDGTYSGGIVVWDNVIAEDPQLKNPAGVDQLMSTWRDGDYTLRAGSPCIDSASSASLPIDWLDADADQSWVEWLPVDAAGLPRVVDDPTAPNVGYGEPPFVDMGAFEYQDDCNENGVIDSLDLANGTSADCTGNGVPDECELDCDGNGLADVCEIDLDPGLDANGNGRLDVCEDVLYVNASASGAATGWTWEDAYTDLQDALPAATLGSEIWVAAGTYRPDGGTGDRALSFELPGGVAVYGGFAGGETSLDQRDLSANPTILSGDIGVPGDISDNSYHVLRINDTSAPAVLDGFVITAGNATGTSPKDLGGGLYNTGDAILRNCAFRSNRAARNGGAISNQTGPSLTLLNCEFSGNHATVRGGGVQTYQSSLTAVNCTFAYNTAGGEGGGVFMNTWDTSLTNCILWGNTAMGGASDESAQIHILAGTLTVDYSCVQHWSGAFGGTGNIGLHPLFVDEDGPDGVAGTPDDNLRLLAMSPCIDAGSNEAVTVETDLDGRPRIRNGGSGEAIVDMGAFEYQEDCNENGVIDSLDVANGTSADCTGNGIPDECEFDCDENGTADVCEIDLDPALDANGNGYLDVCEVLYVNASASGTNTGESWADAVNNLQQALRLVDTRPIPVSQVWVSAGTYRPDRGTGDRALSFELPGGVAVYGGFAGGETSLDQRDLSANPTILSGDIGVPGDISDNSYHVLRINDTSAPAVLDGFVITAGNATGTSPKDLGGGLYNTGDAILRNCAFRSNRAARNGGAISNQTGPSLTLLNCEFSGNHATVRGGGVQTYQSSLTAVNCTFAYNTAGGEGGGVFMNTWDTSLTNCILWGNTAMGGASDESAQIHILAGTLTVDYSCVQHWSGAFGGTGNIGLHPLFVDEDGPDGVAGTPDDNLRLLAMSPCIDAGSNEAVTVETDLDGRPRIRNGGSGEAIVDMGAFEYWEDCNENGVIDSLDLANGTSDDYNENGVPDECEVLYVSASARGTGTGESWANAINDLQEAMSLVDTHPTPVSQIWVARGTYQPDSGTGDRTRSFVLRDGLALYGGFAGRETKVTQRRMQSNPTILSADLGQVRAYHGVDGSGVGPTAVLDGFIIERGYANGPATEIAHWGGGILIMDGSPTVRRCVIRRNYASANGGGVSVLGNSSPTFESCVFVSNFAMSNGGAVQAYQCGLTLTNCTVAGNSASGAGGGIFLNGVQAALTNCISWGNDVRQDYGESSQLHVLNCTPALNYNCVQNWSGTLPGAGLGNIGGDPLFIEQPGIQISGDARLRFGSLAINVGDSAFAPEPGGIDAAGDVRVRCGRIDMGAYEYGQRDPDCDGIIDLEEATEAVPIPTAAPVPRAGPSAIRERDPGRPSE